MGNKSSKITTSHWGAFNVFVENGRIINTEPFHADPAPPNISQLVPNAVHHSKRIDQPYVRKGWLEKQQLPKGEMMNTFLSPGKMLSTLPPRS